MALQENQSLSQEIFSELEEKRQRLENLVGEKDKRKAHLEELQQKAAAIEKLKASDRQSQNARYKEETGMTVGEQIQQQQKDLVKVSDELDAVRGVLKMLESS